MFSHREKQRFCISVFLLFGLLVCGCTEPASARKKKELGIEASVKREVAIGARVAEEIAKNMEFVEDPLVTARVRGIFNRLTPWVKRPLPYNVHVVKEKSPNAFCIPGGNIYVTTGLIDFVRSDAELAFVMAHELSHADGKHGIIQMERNQKLSLAALAIAVASRGAGAAMVLSNVAAVAVSNAYSRDLEQEADLGAVTISANAGYELSAGVTVMESLAAEELKQPWVDPGVYRDHPKISERIHYIAGAVESRGHKIQRKNVLKVLIPRLGEEGNRLLLRVDDTVIVQAPASSEARQLFEGAQMALQRALQMETPVYDIRVDEAGGRPSAVYIGVSCILREPLPKGTDSLGHVRLQLVKALTEARKKHPMANYSL
ncbi:MAG: M48 family metalloprotease [Pyramidobacter porci]|uniref:M48 family metalloprotease n=1 Tax=Pyramidobacter porci TaxID=2605789 RepID=UPI002A74D3E1|nr:M48 family metalloprotease [Pyramidobacter porci]MCI6259661.1 M48 family metalloprotease [Pyramidobacter sp.]MDY2648168.1 M48 family metalloprotease [Pyramidobacter porci]